MRSLAPKFPLLISLILLTNCTKNNPPTGSPIGKNPNAIAVPLIAIVNPLAPIQKKEFPLYTMTKEVLFSAFQLPGIAPILNSIGISQSQSASIPAVEQTLCADTANSPSHLCVRPKSVLAKMAQIQYSIPSIQSVANYPDFSHLTTLNIECNVKDSLPDKAQTACVSAKLLNLLSEYPSLINNLLILQNTLVASLVPAGRSLPTVGETIEGKTYLPEFKGLKILSAKISQLSPSANNESTWKTSVIAAIGENGTLSFETYHIPEDAQNSRFRGLLKGTYPYRTNDSSTEKLVNFSFKYLQNERAEFLYELRVLNPKTELNHRTFTTNGLIDLKYPLNEGHVLKLTGKYNTVSLESILNLDWSKSKFGPLDKIHSVHIPAGSEGKLRGTVWMGLAANQVQAIPIEQSTSGNFTLSTGTSLTHPNQNPGISVPYPFPNGSLPKK